MANYHGRGTPSNGSIYVCNLLDGTNEDMLAEFFLAQLETKLQPTNEPKGDATVTYEDPHAAVAAVEWFNNKEFHGSTIGVFMAESKNKDETVFVEEPVVAVELTGQDDANETNETGSKGMGRGDAAGKAWQQDGDWMCPNTSCSNVNFAFLGVCNRCGSARPIGASGTAAASGGRRRGRGAEDSGGRGRPAGGAPTAGIFGPNDWPCPMCGNINWAKRTKCNICNTNKPGHNEGGVRGGRAGGYKELDEEEIEETQRCRREAEEDDGETYDEFGNLKKKFRAKHKLKPHKYFQGLGVLDGMLTERNGRERSKDRGRDYDDRDNYPRSRDRDDRSDRCRSRSRDRDRDRDKGRGKDRDRDRGRDYDQDSRDYGRDRDRYSRDR
ncbi:TATA-binding protein-associated factor 2N [Ranunculus cassubicifolius]